VRILSSSSAVFSLYTLYANETDSLSRFLVIALTLSSLPLSFISIRIPLLQSLYISTNARPNANADINANSNVLPTRTRTRRHTNASAKREERNTPSQGKVLSFNGTSSLLLFDSWLVGCWVFCGCWMLGCGCRLGWNRMVEIDAGWSVVGIGWLEQETERRRRARVFFFSTRLELDVWNLEPTFLMAFFPSSQFHSTTHPNARDKTTYEKRHEFKTLHSTRRLSLSPKPRLKSSQRHVRKSTA